MQVGQWFWQIEQHSVLSSLQREAEPTISKDRQDKYNVIMAMLNRSRCCQSGNLRRFAMGVHDEKTTFCTRVAVVANLVACL